MPDPRCAVAAGVDDGSAGADAVPDLLPQVAPRRDGAAAVRPSGSVARHAPSGVGAPVVAPAVPLALASGRVVAAVERVADGASSVLVNDGPVGGSRVIIPAVGPAVGPPGPISSKVAAAVLAPAPAVPPYPVQSKAGHRFDPKLLERPLVSSLVKRAPVQREKAEENLPGKVALSLELAVLSSREARFASSAGDLV